MKYVIASVSAILISSSVLYAGGACTRESEAANRPLRNVISLDGTWKLSPILKSHTPPDIAEEMKSGFWKPNVDTTGWKDITILGRGGHFASDWSSLPDPKTPHKSYWFGRFKRSTYNHAWFRRDFKPPILANNQRLFVRFAAVACQSYVWINGKKAGENFGSFSGFELDITNLIDPDKPNTIAVLAATDYGLRPVRRVYGKMFFAGANMGGIAGSVDMIVRPDVFLDEMWITPRLDKSSIEIRYTIKNSSANPRSPVVRAVVKPHGKSRILFDGIIKPASSVDTAGSIHTATIHLPKAKLWWPDQPNLYDLELCLMEANKTVDVKCQRFGMREFIAKGPRFFLNGRRMRLYFGNILTFSQHPCRTPDGRERFRKWLRRQKAQKVNTIRFHMCGAVNTPAMLRVCDEEGMLVVGEWAWFHRVETAIPRKRDREIFFRNNDREMRYWITHSYNHPSLVLWSLANEVWTPGEIPLLEHTYNTFKPLARSGRPVSTSSGFHSVIRNQPLPTDVYDLHNYTMHSAYPHSLMHESIAHDMNVLKKLYQRIDKPVIITESLCIPRTGKITGKLTPELYIKNRKRGGLREVGIAPFQEGCATREMGEVFAFKTLEAFRQEPMIQGFSAWFHNRNHLPASTVNVYGPYYIGFDQLNHEEVNVFAGQLWKASLVVIKDPLGEKTVRVELAVRD